MKIIKLILMFPFFMVAGIFALIAGIIGGKTYHVYLSLTPHKGEPFVSYEFDYEKE